MGAYSRRRTLREETEEVCEEMKGVILGMFEKGEITHEEFTNDPMTFMDPAITYGDKWYEKIIVSRVKRWIKERENEAEKTNKLWEVYCNGEY